MPIEEEKDSIEGIPIPKPNYGILLWDPMDSIYYEAIIIPNFLDEGDKWEFYHWFEGEFPTGEDLKTLKGLIVAGNMENPSLEISTFLKEPPKDLKIVWLGNF